MFLTRGQLIGAVGLAAILAIPMVTFVSAMVVFPILAFGLLAILANVAFPLLIVERGLRSRGRVLMSNALAARAEFAVILWIGCAFGLSHWGSVARSMGANDLSYPRVLFAPVLMLFGIKAF